MNNTKGIISYKILSEQENIMLCYRRGKIWLETLAGERKFIKHKTRLFSFNRIMERLFRLEPRFGFVLNKVFYFSQKGSLYRVNKEEGKTQAIFEYRKRMSSPLAFCKYKSQNKEKVVWGEYWQNYNKESVGIFSFDGESVQQVYKMEGVKHIHNIVYDCYREKLWILTGDTDRESKIMMADLEFNDVRIIFEGNQKYRACVLIPEKEGFIYATDSPLQENYLFFAHEVEEGFSEPTKVIKMPGPCIFGESIQGINYFATSVEPKMDSSILKYLLTKETSIGNVDDNSYVIYGNREKGYSPFCVIKRDWLSGALFGFGNFQITSSFGDKDVYIYATALVKLDGKTIIVKSE